LRELCNFSAHATQHNPYINLQVVSAKTPKGTCAWDNSTSKHRGHALYRAGECLFEIYVKSIKFGVIEIRGGLTGESGPSGLPY
jgi:hypothetical protein